MDIVKLFEKERISIYNFSKKYKCSQEEVIKQLKDAGFLYAKPRALANLIIDLKYASEEYLASDQIQAQEICEKYNIGHETFSKYMKDYLNKPIRARCKAKFYDTYFDKIDNEEKAYILGFFWADGYISSTPIDNTKEKNVYTIEITLQLRDKEILELMKRAWCTPRPILEDTVTLKSQKRFPRCRLIVNSQHMWNTLNNYGCTPRKSLTEKFPDESIFIESDKYSKEELIRHFIRGYFDGDGCISWVNKEHTRPNIQLLGTYDFLNKVLTYLPEKANDLSIRHNHNNPEEIIRFINTSDGKAREIMHYLYKDSTIYLTRKYKRYIALCYSNITNEEDNIGELCDENTEITSNITKGLEVS